MMETVTPAQFKAAVEATGLSPEECGALVHRSQRAIYAYCSGFRRVDPAIYELLLLKTNQKVEESQ